MNATTMNDITMARINDASLQDAIAQARAGDVPQNICLMTTGAADGTEQSLYREGDEVVCYKQDAAGNRSVIRRTPINAQISAQLCSAFLSRNNRS